MNNIASRPHHSTPHDYYHHTAHPGSVLTLALILLWLTGCARQPVLKPLVAPEPILAQTHAWECERNFAFVSHQEGDAMWLFLPGHAVQLPRVVDGPDTNYRSTNIRFQHHDGQARLELPDNHYEHCRNNPQRAIREHAKLNGVDFLASGNAPDWTLEITLNGNMQLVTGADNTTYRFITPEPLILESERKTLYSTQNRTDQIIVELTDSPCRDSNTNEIHEITVHISLNDLRLRGCGSALH
jgi:uncharacterized membrane protein